MTDNKTVFQLLRNKVKQKCTQELFYVIQNVQNLTQLLESSPFYARIILLYCNSKTILSIRLYCCSESCSGEKIPSVISNRTLQF